MEKRGLLSRIGELTRASPGELAVLAILGAAVVGGSTVVYLRTSRPAAPTGSPTVRRIRAPALELSPSPVPLMVHVAGMVVSPGVYELAQGSRVKDALAAAGGALPGADLEVLNLAAPVNDGERVFVSRPGQVLSSDSRAPPAGAPGGSPAGKLNLNTASAAELDSLPGVGPVLAQRILDFRQRKGRFASTRQLREVQGLGPKKYEAIKGLVTV